MKRYFSVSHMSAGFIAVLVGYASSAAIVFQAATAAGARPEHIGSWLFALGLGMGLTCIGLSLRFRSPVLTAWSTPGAALLATALVGVPMAEAVGAFIVASGLIALCGFSGGVERLMKHVPTSLAAGMLAGVLLNFAIGVFKALPAEPLLVGTMLLAYLVGKRLGSRYTIPLTLAAGLGWAGWSGGIDTGALTVEFAVPHFTAPEFSVARAISIGIPLFVVTMSSQNVPGMAVLRANGYATPGSPLIGWTGLTGVVLAPLGGFSFNLAAITAAICMSPEADADPRRRYLAAVWAGIFYLVTGLFGGTIAALLAALPPALIAAIAGIALFGTVANSLAGALAQQDERDAALVTFVVTASGLSLFGIGSAFWGLVAGMAVRWALAPGARAGKAP